MNKKWTVLFICLIFVLGIAIGAVGAANQEEIKALLDYSLKIKLNGSDFTPIGADGNQIRPIIYKSTTYLPVRAIGEALSIAVDYDGKTHTVYLGERDRIPVEGKDYENNYTSQYSTDLSQLAANGKEYKWGIVYTGKAGYYEFSGFVYPNGNYQKFGGVACMEDIDNSTNEVIIKIRENDYQGRVLKQLTVKKGESIPFEIDIPEIKTIYIQNLVSDRDPKSTNPDIMMIAEPYFK